MFVAFLTIIRLVMQEKIDLGSGRSTHYLKAINLKDGKSNSCIIESGFAYLCKNIICTFDRNNVLLVAGDKKSV